MKKIGFLVWMLTLFLAACQTGSSIEPSEISDSAIDRTVVSSHSADIQIEGMTCEMGCGGAIRKALRHTGGVSSVSFDFADNREVNIAKVQFDAKSIDVSELRRVIEALNKGQFKVKTINAQALTKNEVKNKQTKRAEASSGVQMTSPMISLSDFLGSVASWFL